MRSKWKPWSALQLKKTSVKSEKHESPTTVPEGNGETPKKAQTVEQRKRKKQVKQRQEELSAPVVHFHNGSQRDRGQGKGKELKDGSKSKHENHAKLEGLTEARVQELV